MTKKKVLITGASGFIGSYLVKEALERKYDVYAGVRKTSNRNYLSDPRIKFLELDFSDNICLNNQFSNAPYFDFVIHNAGLTKAVKKEDYFISNYVYTKNLVKTLVNLNIVPKKFIYMSSLAAFGPGNESQLNCIKATDNPHPITSYGRSKLESEKYLETLCNFPYIIIRPTVVYGPREKDLFIMFKLINNNIEFIVGSKKQHLTFVYIEDLVKITFTAMESDIINEGYFVSDGNVYDGRVLGAVIKKQLDKKTVKVYIPLRMAKFVALIAESTKYLTGKQSVLNLEKIKELESVNWKCDIQPLIDQLNYSPKYDMKRGVTETIEWYKKAMWLR